MGSNQHDFTGTEDIQYYDIVHEDTVWYFQTLTEHSRQYQRRLEREENSRRTQLRILRKTHDTHLQEKLQLINSLEKVICQQENRLSQLQGEGQCSSTEAWGTCRLRSAVE